MFFAAETKQRNEASSISGGCSSVGRVQDCDSCRRGFESHQPPQQIQAKSPVQRTGLFAFWRSDTAVVYLGHGVFSEVWHPRIQRNNRDAISALLFKRAIA
ncbi:hypothetical protein BO443_20450 [Burkholderia orbicola]